MSTPPTLSPQAPRRLEAFLQGLLRRKDVHHAVVHVESGDGVFRWTGAAGTADPSGRPMTVETPFFIASIDKLYTAACILRLQEEGALSLDAPMAAVLGDGCVAGLHRKGHADHTAAVTIRHLLGHTSGLADFLEDRPKGGAPFVEELVAGGDRSWTTDDSLERVRTELRPHFPPQDLSARRPKVRYCNTNYLLLNAIIEKVTGKPLQAAYQDLVFGPAGATQTWMAGQPQAGPLPEAALWFGDAPLHLPAAFEALQSIYSTTADEVRFLRKLVTGDFFREPATFELMRARWNRFGQPLDRAALRAPSWPVEYGLGIMRFKMPRLLTPRRPVPAVIGHTGSTGTWLFYCPEWDLYLAGTVDQGTAGALPFRSMPRLLNAVRPE